MIMNNKKILYFFLLSEIVFLVSLFCAIISENKSLYIILAIICFIISPIILLTTKNKTNDKSQKILSCISVICSGPVFIYALFKCFSDFGKNAVLWLFFGGVMFINGILLVIYYYKKK